MNSCLEVKEYQSAVFSLSLLDAVSHFYTTFFIFMLLTIIIIVSFDLFKFLPSVLYVFFINSNHFKTLNICIGYRAFF
jgi:hypothetical protein